MKLIVGLGNPGENYSKTRHNVGFMTLDALAKYYNVEFKLDKKQKGMIATVNKLGNKAILLKPTTYMNLSGEAVRSVCNYYDIKIEDILVISDDLDLPVGKIRLRDKGSAGGHNGLKSINENLKTQEYKRIKIGIDKSSVIPVVDYVLGKFSQDDMITIDQKIEKIISALDDFISDVDYKKISSYINM